MLALCIDPVGKLERKLYYIYPASDVYETPMVSVFDMNHIKINSSSDHKSWIAKRFKLIYCTPLVGV